MYVARKAVLPNGKKSVKVYKAIYKQRYGSDDFKGYKIKPKGKPTPVKPRTVAFFDKKEALEYAASMRGSDKRRRYSMFKTKRIGSRKRPPKRTPSAYIKYMKANLGNMKGMSLEESSQHLKKVGLGWKKLTADQRKKYQ